MIVNLKFSEGSVNAIRHRIQCLHDNLNLLIFFDKLIQQRLTYTATVRVYTKMRKKDGFERN